MQSGQAAGACLQRRLQAAGALRSQQMGHDAPLSLFGSRKDSMQPIAVCATKAAPCRLSEVDATSCWHTTLNVCHHVMLAAAGLSPGYCSLESPSHSLEHELFQR